MKQKTTRVIQKCLSLLLTAAILLTTAIPSQAKTVTQDDADSPQTKARAGERELPKNPVHHCVEGDATDWSYVYFGSYPQTEVTGDALTSAITGASYDENGDAWIDGIKYRRISRRDTNYDRYFGDRGYRYFKWERIKWRVLQNDGSTLFVAADKGLDCKDYHEEKDTDITWEDCTLRNWLNNSFYQTAFSSAEQGAVVEQNVVNDDNTSYGTEGGNNTNDKVYLLSIGEATNPAYGFCEDYEIWSVSRHLKGSDYANTMGAYVLPSYRYYTGNCFWWLRSPGDSSSSAAFVGSPHEYIHKNGCPVTLNSLAVMPALHINLSSDLWFLADDGSSGEVSGTDGTERKELPKNPVHHCMKDDAIDWSYVYFGSYPQTEVTGDALTSAITGASYDESGDAWIDGTKYRRMKRSDANCVNYNSSGLAYFSWKDDNDYHYFKWERIKWRVLSNDGSTLFVAADKGLDCKDYNEENIPITWEDCTLRSWLNSSFYQTAFSSAEQGAVVEQNVVNGDKFYYGTEGGSNTNDKVYLLSIGETTNPAYGFCEGPDTYSVSRSLKPSDYAYARGVCIVDNSGRYKGSGNCPWWLRSPGHDTNWAAFVSNTGDVFDYGAQVDGIAFPEAVVPALHINLSSDLWSLTDDGSSGEGGGSGTETPPTCTEHTWSEGTVSKVPTCTQKGEKEYTCTVCGETKTEEVAKTEHTWSEGKVTKAPTCIEKGEKEYTCTVCGETKTEEVAKTEHTYKATGEKKYTCTMCGKIVKKEELSQNPVHHCTKKNDGTDTTDWSYVWFGSYPQTEVMGDALTPAITGASYDANGDAWVNGTKYRRISKRDTNYDGYFGYSKYRYFKWERIKWRVLSNDGSTLFVAADQGLDCKDYNEECRSITWENCTLRSWLNSSFYQTAFSSAEQGAVVEQDVVNDDDPVYGTEGGNNTNDKVYLLSMGEVTNPIYGFCEDDFTYSVSRRLKASDYAHAKGAKININTSSDYAGNCWWWWLRSPGNDVISAAYVGHDGFVSSYSYFCNVDNYFAAVVPALHINLSSDLWFLTDDGSSGEGGGSGTGDGPPTCTEHTWSEGVVTKTPTCTQKGEKEYTCTVCGETKTEELEKTAHTYEFTGEKEYVCTVCGKVTEREELTQNPVHHCTKKNNGTDATDWSYVYFGSYPQTEVTGDALTSAITGAAYDANGDAWIDGIKYRRIGRNDTNNTDYFGDSKYRYFKWERIKWRVLQNDGSTLFVAADKGLDCKDYHEEDTSITWENCTLRSWLNSSFYQTAFSSAEQGAVVEQNVVNDDNPEHGTEGGNNTKDKVYLLSIGETTNPAYGFCEDYSTYSVSRRLTASDYAHARGAYINDDNDYAGNCRWWLRSPGGGAYSAAYVDHYGYVDSFGDNVYYDNDAVVPALHINLSSDLWSLADDGSSGEGGGSGTGDEPPTCTEHTWSEGVATKAPTCTEKGEKEYTCTVCGEKKTEEIEATGSHTWDKGKESKAPTCTQKGEKEYTCTICGEKKTEELAKTAHTYQTVLTKATTAKNGSTKEECTGCGKVKNQKTIFAVKSAALKTFSYTYNGKKKKPSVTVKDSQGKMIDKGNYTLTYQNNIKVGKATVTIKLKGNYKGKITKTFQIIPKGTSISGKITAKSKGLTVKWKKQPKSTTGYQIQVSTSKKFAKKATVTKTVKKNSITKLTVKKLKPKKKYYVRIRTYKTVKGKKFCSSWSKAKTVTTKK